MARRSRLGTRVVRSARTLPAGEGVPVAPPLVQSVAFDYRSAAKHDEVFGNERAGYVYGRYGTPTTAALESALAEIEETAAATCFVSGMAAIAAFVDACAVASRGRVLTQEDIYGQTRALFERWIRERGAAIEFVDATDLAQVESALRDATSTSPVLVRPTALGADVVIHSLTKYVNGHGDVMGGVVAGSADVAKAMRDRTILDGSYMPPHEAWLTIRGMRTLELRVRRQCESALRVAEHLATHPKIARVRYPGLATHPQHELARRQFDGLFGGVVTFDLNDATKAAAFRFLDALELGASATTLGDLFTEVLYPAISSHRRVAPEERARLGINEGTLRLSVGIEDAEDVIADLDGALNAV